MKKLSVFSLMLASFGVVGVANAAEINCYSRPSCKDLGYEQEDTDCTGRKTLKCPFGDAYFCGDESAPESECSYIYSSTTGYGNSCVKNGTTYYENSCSGVTSCSSGYTLKVNCTAASGAPYGTCEQNTPTCPVTGLTSDQLNNYCTDSNDHSGDTWYFDSDVSVSICSLANNLTLASVAEEGCSVGDVTVEFDSVELEYDVSADSGSGGDNPVVFAVNVVTSNLRLSNALTVKSGYTLSNEFTTFNEYMRRNMPIIFEYGNHDLGRLAHHGIGYLDDMAYIDVQGYNSQITLDANSESFPYVCIDLNMGSTLIFNDDGTTISSTVIAGTEEYANWPGNPWFTETKTFRDCKTHGPVIACAGQGTCESNVFSQLNLPDLPLED